MLHHCALTAEYGWLGDVSASLQMNLKRSVLSYEIALDTTSHSQPSELHTSSLKKRLGNVQNELGVHYMNASAAVLNEEGRYPKALCYH